MLIAEYTVYPGVYLLIFKVIILGQLCGYIRELHPLLVGPEGTQNDCNMILRIVHANSLTHILYTCIKTVLEPFHAFLGYLVGADNPVQFFFLYISHITFRTLVSFRIMYHAYSSRLFGGTIVSKPKIQSYSHHGVSPTTMCATIENKHWLNYLRLGFFRASLMAE